MATTNFTTSLKLALPTTGDLTGTWGQTVNDSITTLLDTAVAGNITKDMATLGTDWTLTSNNGATDEARYAILIPYGNTGATRSIFAPKVSKAYIIVNKTNASVIIRGGPTSPTTGVTVATGATVVVAWDSNLATPDFVAVTPASISGVVPVANGGTGLTAVGTTGNILTSNGTAWVSSPPSTTVTTATNLAGGSAGTIPYQSASGTTAMLAAGTATYVLTSNGAAAPTWQPPTSVSGYLPLTGGTMTGNITFNAGQTFTGTVSIGGALGTPSSGTLSSCTVDGTDAVGFRNIPVNSQSAAYTAVLADSGKCILHPSTDANARTFTLPANSSVAYPVGTAISFVNMTSQVVSIAITSDTMYLAGTGTTGTRSLAIYGTATALKINSTTWIISGVGLT